MLELYKYLYFRCFILSVVPSGASTSSPVNIDVGDVVLYKQRTCTVVHKVQKGMKIGLHDYYVKDHLTNLIHTTAKIYLKKMPPSLTAEMSAIGDMLAMDDSDEEMMAAAVTAEGIDKSAGENVICNINNSESAAVGGESVKVVTVESGSYSSSSMSATQIPQVRKHYVS